MRTVNIVIEGAWLAFFLVWTASAFSAKRSVSRGGWLPAVVRVCVVLIALRLFGVHLSRPAAGYTKMLGSSVTLSATGAVLTALGMAWAIWARVHIGRNWGMPMSRKEAPELVTSGPYRYVRHPIYSGVLVAMLGSALASGFSWLLMLGPFTAYFAYAATREERLMLQQFGEQYSAYKQRTKMLVPFVF